MLNTPLSARIPPDLLGQLLQTFKFAHVGMLRLAADLRILDANELACAIAEQPRHALIGSSLFTAYCAEPDMPAIHTVTHALQTAGYWNGQIKLEQPDGTPCCEEISLAACPALAGQESGYLAILSNYSHACQADAASQRIAHFDPLTGLPNRLLLLDRIEQIIAANRRSDSLLAVCFLDLDGFKHVNDTLGHAAGDSLLKEAAQRMLHSLRSADTIARIGGDEFVVLLPALDDEDECHQTIERLLKVIAEPYSPTPGTQVQISASIGVTIFPNDDSHAEDLIRHADHAMYAAKQAGKNAYRMFDARMEERLEARQDTLLRVSQAMRTGQFELHYQPLLDIGSQEIIGIEALVRWNHPILGCLFPGEFLPLIDDNNAALELGEWVIRHAVAQSHDWHGRGIRLALSINIFARQLQQPGFPALLGRIIGESWPDMPPGQLILDIAEPTTAKALDTAQNNIRACRALGVHVHLDEFGARDSALKSLRMLGLDGIKIYRSLVNDMLDDRISAQLVEGIACLGKAFGLRVTAVGVASTDQARHLRDLGCDSLQGYQISPPLTATGLEAWLSAFSANRIWSTA